MFARGGAKMKTIKQIAEKYGVTTMGVRHWIKEGNIPTEWEKEVGVRRRLIVDEKKIEAHLTTKGKIKK